MYFQEKMSKKNVGTKFGVSEFTIVRVFKENKWGGRKQGESAILSKQEFKKLVDSGKSDEEIATITGLSKASLNHKRRQLGIAKKIPVTAVKKIKKMVLKAPINPPTFIIK